MGYWHDGSPETNERLEEIAELYLLCRDTFHDVSSQFRWLPQPGSPAAIDAEMMPSPDPLLEAAPGETGHRLIVEVVQTYLLTASGHMGGLAALYSSGEVFFSPPALIRAVIENCAHALWVLGDDSDEPPENRLARAYAEDLLSAEEAKKNAGRMRLKTHPTYDAAKETYTEIKRQIQTRFPTTDNVALGKHIVNGQALLGPEATVAWMYDLTERSGGTISVRAGIGVYGFLSNLTHPTLYPARQMRSWVVDPGTGFNIANLRLDMDFVENQARAALAAFYNALTYVTSYFGWSTAPIEALATKIEARMPTFFI
ncbi:hypothetical protein LLS1_01580 [Leifsonia sp. LS1]|uniref:hypothetical protein n=1 Tax=Leifsonia sp. LS1 TaxID=2828483 RepID=UPI001CFEE2E9|nr:hypothetical protein [Leifsonia sp. LS1]GIT78489.1 hypothetical protein LLS1_01580 [Leifsonia sp. LS1]